ncbi:MAG: tetratricopeptide repeat protein, partial [Candidatus Firestonebacteria bacterium]
TGDFYWGQGNKKQALFELGEADKISFDMDWVQHEIGMIFGRYGDRGGYLKQMEKAAALYRNSLERRNNLGNAYLSFDRFEEAVGEFKAAVKYSPGVAAPYHNMAIGLNALGRRDEAKESYLEAGKLGQVESLQALLLLCLEDKDLDKYLPGLENIFRRFPTNSDVYVNLGITCEQKGRPEEAEKFFKTILRALPANPYARISLGNIYINSNRVQEAAGEYEMAINYNPGLTEGYYNLGVAYFKMNKITEAKSLWLKTLELSPGHVGAKNGLTYLK